MIKNFSNRNKNQILEILKIFRLLYHDYIYFFYWPSPPPPKESRSQVTFVIFNHDINAIWELRGHISVCLLKVMAFCLSYCCCYYSEFYCFFIYVVFGSTKVKIQNATHVFCVCVSDDILIAIMMMMTMMIEVRKSLQVKSCCLYACWFFPFSHTDIMIIIIMKIMLSASLHTHTV